MSAIERRETPGATMLADLSSLGQVRELTERVGALTDRLDALY